MMTDENKNESYILITLMSSQCKKTPDKAIYSIRETFQDNIYQTKGIACAVNVQGSGVRLLTWRGVIGETTDCSKSVIMDRCCSRFPEHLDKHRLKMEDIREESDFSFLSVGPKDKNNICSLDVKECFRKTSDFVAFSFSGTHTFSLKFEYDKKNHRHKLVVQPESVKDVLKHGILEKSSIIGSPIIVEEDNHNSSFSVVGVVGVNDQGELCPCFITESVLAPRPSPTEGSGSPKHMETVDESESKEKAPSSNETGHRYRNNASPSAYAGQTPAGISSNKDHSNAADSRKGDALDERDDSSSPLVEALPHPVAENSTIDHLASCPGTTFSDSPKCGFEVHSFSAQPKEVNKPSKSPSESSKLVTGQDSSMSRRHDVTTPGTTVKKGTVPKELLPDLAFDVQGKWKPLGRALGLNETELTTIKTDIKNDRYEQTMKMLSRWLEAKGRDATYEALAEALQATRLNSVCESYCLVGHSPPRPPIELPEILMSGTVDKGVRWKVAYEAREKWKRLGRVLEIDEQTLSTIERNNEESITEQSCQMMSQWYQSKGSQATYQELAKALLHRTVDMAAVVEKLLCRERKQRHALSATCNTDGRTSHYE